jgi:hypothetical protein
MTEGLAMTEGHAMTAHVLLLRHRRVARAFAEALLALHEDPRRLDAVVDTFEAHLARVSRSLRRMLLLALDLLRWLPLLFFVSLRPFEALRLEQRRAVLERMERSPATLLLLPLVAYKALFSMIFFEGADELRALGYRGDDRQRRRHTA